MSAPRAERNQAIDWLRGAVMILMALDHSRMFVGSAVDLHSAAPGLYFTRWVTHFCAPVFVLLAGTAAYLHGQRLGSTRALSRYLFREHSRAPRASDDRRQRRPALGAKPARRSGVALCLRRVVDVGARPRSATRGSPGQHWPPRSPIRAGAPLDHVNDLGWTALIESIVLGAVNSGARARCKAHAS
jgi:hypothetical protein